MIHYLPLERLDARNTTEYDNAITDYLAAKCIPHVRHYPLMGGREQLPPAEGEFINTAVTLEFKARQLASLFQHGLQHGDLVFCTDLWFPGIEGIGYYAYFAGINVRLRGLLHAGSFTDTDFVRNLERWAAPFETSVLDLCERVFVGSHFMRHDLLAKRMVEPGKVVVTGFPLDHRVHLTRPWPWAERDDIVVFAARNCDEKQPWLLDELATALALRGVGARYVNTFKEGYTKRELYELLAHAKVIVSFALQENFGVSIMEGTLLGCVPVVPDRLAYPEFYDAPYRYGTFSECVAMVHQALDGNLPSPPVPNFNHAVEEWFAE